MSPPPGRPLPPMQALAEICGAVIDGSRDIHGLDTDWEALAALAETHRVTPLVWRRVQAGPPASFPSRVAERLRQASLETARRGLMMTAELLRIDEAFGQSGITYAPNKGAALAQELYGDVSLRVFGDLDLVVEPGSLARALDALEELGYAVASSRPEPISRRALLEFAARRPGEVPLIHAGRSIVVDLHWSVLGRRPLPGYSLARSLDPQKLTVAGRPLPRFRSEDLFIFLSLHGFKHGWERLNWLVDLGRLLAVRGRELDWPAIASRLGPGDPVPVLTGVLLAESVFHLGLPDLGGVFPPRPLTAASGLARTLGQGLLGQPGNGADGSPTRLLPLYWRANLTLPARLRWLAGYLESVGFEDLDRARLPPGWFWLHYPTRLIRLAWKYLPPGRRGD